MTTLVCTGATLTCLFGNDSVIAHRVGRPGVRDRRGGCRYLVRTTCLVATDQDVWRTSLAIQGHARRLQALSVQRSIDGPNEVEPVGLSRGPWLTCGVRRGSGQEPAVPSAAAISWIASASAALTLCPPSR